MTSHLRVPQERRWLVVVVVVVVGCGMSVGWLVGGPDITGLARAEPVPQSSPRSVANRFRSSGLTTPWIVVFTQVVRERVNQDEGFDPVRMPGRITNGEWAALSCPQKGGALETADPQDGTKVGIGDLRVDVVHYVAPGGPTAPGTRTRWFD